MGAAGELPVIKLSLASTMEQTIDDLIRGYMRMLRPLPA